MLAPEHRIPARPGRRSRQPAPRSHLVKFFLTDGELAELNASACRAGLARGAFAAEAALSVARGSGMPTSPQFREALVEFMRAAGLVRRIGVNLNQAVAQLNSTGQPGQDLAPAARMCARVIARLDETAEQVRRNIP
jgi:Bacterial mobilisation protein (MobC)